MGDLTVVSEVKKKKENPLTCFVIMPYGNKGEYTRENIESDYIFNSIINKAIKKYEKFSGRSINLNREVDKKMLGV